MSERARPPGRNRKVKRLWWIRIHRWTGFGLLVWFVFEAVSGSYLAIAEDLEPMLHRDRYHHGSTDLGVGAASEAVLAQAAKADQDVVVSEVIYPREAHGVYQISTLPRDGDGPGEATYYVDPSTVEVNGTGDAYGDFWTTVIGLHADFNTGSLLGISTRQLVGWLGIVWLVNLALGFVVMRRRRRALRPSWAFKRGRTRRAFHLAVHNWVGLVILVPALVAVVTGIALEFPAKSDAVIGAALPGTVGDATGTTPYSTPSGAGKRAELSVVEEKVRAADLGPIEYIEVPVGVPTGVYQVVVDGGGYSPYTAGGRQITVYVDQYSGEPIGLSDPASRSMAEQVSQDWVYGLHFGWFAGWLSKVLWILLGLGTVALSVTALYIRAGRYPWQNRARRRAERAVGADSAQLELVEPEDVVLAGSAPPTSEATPAPATERNDPS